MESFPARKDPANSPGHVRSIRAAYIRVSTEEQNLGLQESLIEAQKPDITYSDKDSGTFVQRRGYTWLCKAIQEGKVLAVIVYRLDRLGRNPIELIRFFDLLEKHQVKFISLTEPWLTDWNMGPMNYLIWWQQIGMARFELLLLKDRQRRGIDTKQERVKKGLDSWKGRGPDKQPRKKHN